MALTRPVDPDPTGVKSELLANFIFEQLVGEANATLPTIDLTNAKYDVPWDEDSPVFKPVEKPTIEELLAQFHALMGGVGTHITKEFEAGRITGAKYADIYLALMQGAMQSAVQFALGKDQAFWMAAKTQADAITAQMQNEIAKLQAMLARANYALTKLKLATEDSQFGQGEYQRKYILPVQKDMVTEQANSQRAQTLDKRLDDTDVSGLLGVQKILYETQVASYKEDTKIKAAKIFSDLWVTMYSNDDSTKPSDYFRSFDNTPGQENSAEALDGIFKVIRLTAMGGVDPGGYTPETNTTTADPPLSP